MSIQRTILLIVLILLHLAAFSQEKKFVKKNYPPPVSDSLPGQKPIVPLNPLYYQFSLQQGLICRKEYQLAKRIGFPFRFRLGSAAYVDWLEQKPNARKD